MSSDTRPHLADRHGLRLVREEEGSPFPKASLFLRAGARIVDLAFAVALYGVTDRAGVVFAFLYVLCADGFLNGQSIGKKAFGVKVIHLPTRTPARYRESVLRNAPFGLVMLLGMMPEIGEKAFVAGALVIGAVEAWKVMRDPLGIRLGDAWAQTQVIDGKVVAGATVVSTPEAARAPGRLMRDEHQEPGAPRDRTS